MAETSVRNFKKLNNEYYNLEGETQKNCYIVGSVGRKTAECRESNLDIIFNLPADKFSQYNQYESNGQSQLLQDVKLKLALSEVARHPRATRFFGII